MNNFTIATESPKIEVTESKSTYTHGYIKGQVTNDTTGQIGAVRFSENSDNITPLSETVTSAPAGCGTGASWNATTSACECPVYTVWSGKECLPYGSPGVCPGGQGWDFVSRTCLTLTALPAVPNVYIPGTGIAGGHSPSAPDISTAINGIASLKCAFSLSLKLTKYADI